MKSAMLIILITRKIRFYTWGNLNNDKENQNKMSFTLMIITLTGLVKLMYGTLND